MPAGVAPAGSETGEVASSARSPPVTAKTPTAPALLSSTYRVRPSGLRRASTAPTPPVALTGVLPSRVSAPPKAIDESAGPGEYNFRTKAEFEAMGSDFFATDQPFEMPGRSCFLQIGGRVFHTYSQYARGLESTGGSYYFLDLTALGRQEEWEEPKGRSKSARSATPDFAS